MISFKLLLFLFGVFNSLDGLEEITPYDIIAEVHEQLRQLESIILGNIQVAHDNFNTLFSDVLAFSSYKENVGIIEIDQITDQTQSQLTQIKDLAASINVDISSCTIGREDTLIQLPIAAKGEMNQCITDQDTIILDVLREGIYRIDIHMSVVQKYETQLETCGDSVLCVMPILNNIELDKVQIPQKIKLEINSATSNTDSIKLIIGQCKDDQVAHYTTASSNVLNEIIQCANAIMS